MAALEGLQGHSVTQPSVLCASLTPLLHHHHATAGKDSAMGTLWGVWAQGDTWHSQDTMEGTLQRGCCGGGDSMGGQHRGDNAERTDTTTPGTPWGDPHYFPGTPQRGRWLHQGPGEVTRAQRGHLGDELLVPGQVCTAVYAAVGAVGAR